MPIDSSNPLVYDPSRRNSWNWNPDRKFCPFVCEEPLTEVNLLDPTPEVEDPNCIPQVKDENYLKGVISGYFPSFLKETQEGRDTVEMLSCVMAHSYNDLYQFDPNRDLAIGRTADFTLLQYIADNLGLHLENFLVDESQQDIIEASWKEQIRTAVYKFKTKGTLPSINSSLRVIGAELAIDPLYETLDSFNSVALIPFSSIAPTDQFKSDRESLFGNFSCLPEIVKVNVPDVNTGITTTGMSNGYLIFNENNNTYYIFNSSSGMFDIAGNPTVVAVADISLLSTAGFENGDIVYNTIDGFYYVYDVVSDSFLMAGNPSDVTLTSVTDPLGRTVLEYPDVKAYILANPLGFDAGLVAALTADTGNILKFSDKFLLFNSTDSLYYIYDSSSAADAVDTVFIKMLPSDVNLSLVGLTNSNYAQTSQVNVTITFNEFSIIVGMVSNAIDLSIKLILDTKPFHMTLEQFTIAFRLEEILFINECLDFVPTVEVFDILCKPACCRYHFEEDDQVHCSPHDDCTDEDMEFSATEFIVQGDGTFAVFADTLAKAIDAGVLIANPTDVPSFTAPGAEIFQDAFLVSDDFNVTVLNAVWTVDNDIPGNRSLTTNPGFLTIDTQLGDFEAADTSYENLILRDLPFGDYMVTTKVSIDATANNQQAGIVLWLDADNHVKISKRHDTSTKLEAVHEVAGVVTTVATVSWSNTTDVYLRLAKVGSSFDFLYSSDGATFALLGTASPAIVPEEVGLFAFNGDPSAAASVEAKFDMFAMFSPKTLVAEDDGTGTLIDSGTGWFSAGSITYSSGVISGTFVRNIPLGISISSDYKYVCPAEPNRTFTRTVCDCSVEINDCVDFTCSVNGDDITVDVDVDTDCVPCCEAISVVPIGGPCCRFRLTNSLCFPRAYRGHVPSGPDPCDGCPTGINTGAPPPGAAEVQEFDGLEGDGATPTNADELRVIKMTRYACRGLTPSEAGCP